MGESSTETVKEIEDLRGRIEGNIRQLEERMPQAGVWAKRALGVALSSVGLLMIRGLLKARKARKKGKELDEDSLVLVRLGDLQDLNGGRRVPVVVEEE